MNQQYDIRDLLGEIAAGPMLRGGGSKLERLLKHFSAAGIPLSVCADKRHLGRSVGTLRRYACRMSLKFPDWVPMHMRPNKENKANAT